MTNKKWQTVLFLITLFLWGCRVVPIQVARVTQIETYEQTYNLENETQIAKVLEKLVGEKNWKILIDYLGSSEYIQELKSQDIAVKGNFISSMTLDPQNHNMFLFEGFGRYYVVRKTTKEVLFSADFRILENTHSVDDFKSKGFVGVDIQQFMIRHFPTDSEKNYFHEIPFHMKVAVTSPQEGVYSVDYTKPHELIIDGKTIGHLHFPKKLSNKKLIDMRGIGFLRNDY